MPDIMAELMVLAAGLILLVLVMVMVAQERWEGSALAKARELFSVAPEDDPGIVQESDLAGLPD